MRAVYGFLRFGGRNTSAAAGDSRVATVGSTVRGSDYNFPG
jgi:hypothetical protein